MRLDQPEQHHNVSVLSFIAARTFVMRGKTCFQLWQFKQKNKTNSSLNLS